MKKIRITLLLTYIIAFIVMIVSNVNIKNKNEDFITKSYSIPLDTLFFNNHTTIDKNENLYVVHNMLSIVEVFDKNGKFIKSICINNDIDTIKNEKDGVHVYAGKFKYIDYKITENKIIEKKISEKEMDHVKSDSKEKVIGNIWIRDGKIVFLRTDIFPIDVTAIIIIAVLVEGIFFIKSKIKGE